MVGKRENIAIGHRERHNDPGNTLGQPMIQQSQARIRLQRYFQGADDSKWSAAPKLSVHTPKAARLS